MPSFFVSKLSDRAPAERLALRGFSASGEIRSEALFPIADRPLRAWVHELRRGATFQWTEPPVGHAIYVLDGELQADNERLGRTAALLVEHGATATCTVTSDTARIVHFHRDESIPEAPSRSGGHSHLVSSQGIFQFQSQGSRPHYGVIYADSGCPNCELWLHASLEWGPNKPTTAHYHTTDEIIYVLDGSMMFGKREVGVGEAVAIDANTTYKFATGDRGLSFLNFRASEPYYIEFLKDGAPPVSLNERDMLRGRPRSS